MTEQPRFKTTLPVCPKCGSATFWNNTDGIQTLFCISDDCKWKQQIRSRPHTPAPEPDEKCEICGNPLEYHNNAYRWCKNMHSFRYFQTPHTSTPAPSELAATAYQAGIECGREEGATQAREDVLDELAQMYANVPEQFLEGTYRLHSEWKEKIESLRHEQERE